MRNRALVVVATPGEAARLGGLDAPGLGVQVVVSGVGPVAAALATQRALLGADFALAVSAGIGGAYPASGLGPGDLAVSSEIVQADLGAWDGGAWLGLDGLGLSVLPDRPHPARFAAWTGAGAVAERLGAAFGPTLTLSSVTGDHETARTLQARVPGALTEGMEGAGVAHAALLAGVPVVEVRGVSNLVGPRDRAAWRIGEALDATRRGLEAVLAGLLVRGAADQRGPPG
ncbi:futalosine hydrolase [Deinococcus koreensis]|uniref:Futalosine hydrolase n=1 Tax=Deinococcus koreensis TaxID=2054903 RepID=A0A2K3UX25_9DEIO|nr:futalosine hydrolase [Deinococcus koreensis]PNY81086.1 futalosine hydrolase [Deinococcus koreensis]